MQCLDRQMRHWSDRLIFDIKISEEDAQKLATTIESEVRWLPKEAKDEIRQSSPIEIKHRYEELLSFQGWMDIANKFKDNPFIVRAQVIVQNYICFVYLNESCFNVVRKHVSNQSACKKCCKFLLNNPVRAFRNAIAHSNWCYNEDFSCIRFWARKGATQDEDLHEFEVTNEELSFWQALARCTAYAVYENLK